MRPAIDAGVKNPLHWRTPRSLKANVLFVWGFLASLASGGFLLLLLNAYALDDPCELLAHTHIVVSIVA